MEKLKCVASSTLYRFECGRYYEILERRTHPNTGIEYSLFRISGTTKANSDVESIPSSMIYDYFERIEVTRNYKIEAIIGSASTF
jgi:hypothetical protein